MKTAIGTHFIVELDSCNSEILDDVKLIEEYLVTAAEKSKATILKTYFHKFHPVGVTGIISLAESHISIHTWPELGYAAVDIFTCGNIMNPQVALDYIVEKFECKTPRITELKRGNLSLPKELILI